MLESALDAIMGVRADMACEDGANSRSGCRGRGLPTPAGKITLRIPKLRSGTTSLRAPWSATVASTRKDERVDARLGIDGLSESQASRVCERLDAEITEPRAGEFSIGKPHLFLNATYVKFRRDNRAQSTVAVTAVAVGADGAKRVVGSPPSTPRPTPDGSGSATTCAGPGSPVRDG